MASTFSLTGSLRLSPVWVEPLDASTVTDATTTLVSFAFENGTGTGEANAYWRDVRTVAAETTDSIDLSSLPVSVFGGTGSIDMPSVKAIYVRNLSATVPLRYAIKNGSTTQLPPGGVFLFISGTAAAAEFVWLSDDQLIEIENASGTPAQYQIILVGVKA